MTHRTTTIVLLDPTNPDGEAALAALEPSDDDVAVVVLLTGPCSSALRDFARAENVSLADAGWTYLEQVEATLAGAGRVVEMIVATGPDTAFELASIVHDRSSEIQHVNTVLVPPSVVRADPRLVAKFERWSDARLRVTDSVVAR